MVLIFVCSIATAQKATHAARKKAATVNVPAESVAPAKRSPRESALRKVALAPFAARGGITPEQAASLTKQVANDVTAMSYWSATPIASGLMAKAEMLKATNEAGLDGVIAGQVSPDNVKGWILSRSGDMLGSFSIDRDVQLSNDAQVKDLSRVIVDEVARAVPYRGFITGKKGDGLYELNLGKDHGILVGQRFRLFDFSAGTFGSAKVDLGEVQVVEVGETTSIVEPTGNTEVRPFAKIGFNENANGMSMPQQMETRGSVHVGGGLLNISGTGDPKYVDRAYNVSSTPGFLLGGGWGKFAIDVLFAQAKGDQTDLVYTEVIANDRLVDLPFGGLNRFSVWAGGRVALVNVTTKRNFVTPLASTTSVSPEFEARLDRIIKGPVRGFIDASAYFPIFVSGMDAGAILFSYGVGGDAGLSLDISQRLFLDVGGRFHLIRRPVEGQSSVYENYTELFTDLGFRF